VHALLGKQVPQHDVMYMCVFVKLQSDVRIVIWFLAQLSLIFVTFGNYNVVDFFVVQKKSLAKVDCLGERLTCVGKSSGFLAASTKC
jgi:hypothetical protein